MLTKYFLYIFPNFKFPSENCLRFSNSRNYFLPHFFSKIYFPDFYFPVSYCFLLLFFDISFLIFIILPYYFLDFYRPFLSLPGVLLGFKKC